MFGFESNLFQRTQAIRHKFAQQERHRHLSHLSHRWNSASSGVLESAGSRDSRSIIGRVSVRVINLENRPDRLLKISKQLENLGVRDWNRVVGFDGKEFYPQLAQVIAGSVGCEISHIAAISAGISPETEAVMVCEDDLEFVASRIHLEAIITEFLEDSRLDVLSLSGRPRGGSIPISDNLRVVIGLVGRGCYLIKPHMISPLVEVFSDGLKKLNRGDLKGKGDLEWREVQSTKYFFAFPRQDVAQQAAGFSDIEGKHLGPR